MATENFDINSLLADRLAAGDFPSAVYLVWESGHLKFRGALGFAVRKPEPIPTTVDTIYDLASLTKPLVTGTLCARAIESGALTLADPVVRFLPEFSLPDKATITVQQLLTHSSGLTPWLPFAALCASPAGVIERIASTPLDYLPGSAVKYSDLGFICLGRVLEIVYEVEFAELARRQIFLPLGLGNTFLNPSPELRPRIAASETGNGFELNKAAEMGIGKNYDGWRRELVWGQVHDGNAYFLGGAAGHAGLFATADDALVLAQQALGSSTKLLRSETCGLFQRDLTPGLEEARSVAWQLAATPGSAAGPDLPPDAFGHLGFTGTSCWIDPHRERIFILLTNRTHDRELPFVLINNTRRRFHSLAVAALDRTSVM